MRYGHVTSLPTSPREEDLMAANDGLKRSLVDVLRTRSNVGTEPFFGRPADEPILICAHDIWIQSKKG